MPRLLIIDISGLIKFTAALQIIIVIIRIDEFLPIDAYLAVPRLFQQFFQLR